MINGLDYFFIKRFQIELYISLCLRKFSRSEKVFGILDDDTNKTSASKQGAPIPFIYPSNAWLGL